MEIYKISDTISQILKQHLRRRHPEIMRVYGTIWRCISPHISYPSQNLGLDTLTTVSVLKTRFWKHKHLYERDNPYIAPLEPIFGVCFRTDLIVKLTNMHFCILHISMRKCWFAPWSTRYGSWNLQHFWTKPVFSA